MKQTLLTALCLSAVFMPQGASAVIPDDGKIEFEILRDGKPFGSHTVSFDEQGSETRVSIDIEMKYTLGPVTLFRYEHSNEEIWQGDKVVSLVSQTNDDGDDYAVNASWGSVLNVEANGQRFEAPAGVYTTSYWNPITLKTDKLLNTQKGQVEEVQVSYKGQEEFTTGVDVLKADRYAVEATLPLEVWYDANTQQWVGLSFEARGSKFEYRRLNAVE